MDVEPVVEDAERVAYFEVIGSYGDNGENDQSFEETYIIYNTVQENDSTGIEEVIVHHDEEALENNGDEQLQTMDDNATYIFVEQSEFDSNSVIETQLEHSQINVKSNETLHDEEPNHTKLKLCESTSIDQSVKTVDSVNIESGNVSSLLDDSTIYVSMKDTPVCHKEQRYISILPKLLREPSEVNLLAKLTSKVNQSHKSDATVFSSIIDEKVDKPEVKTEEPVVKAKEPEVETEEPEVKAVVNNTTDCIPQPLAMIQIPMPHMGDSCQDQQEKTNIDITDKESESSEKIDLKEEKTDLVLFTDIPETSGSAYTSDDSHETHTVVDNDNGVTSAVFVTKMDDTHVADGVSQLPSPPIFWDIKEKEKKRRIQLKCRHCQAKFKTEEELKQHKSSHFEGTDGHICSLCGETFATISKVKEHEKHTHIKPGKFQCKFCNKLFCTSARRRMHEYSHDPDKKPHICSVEGCGRGFKDKWSLEVHMSVHNNTKEFKCYLCGESFARKQYLNFHLERHKQNKVIRCQVCAKKFMKLIKLGAHMAMCHPNVTHVFKAIKSFDEVKEYVETTKQLNSREDATKRICEREEVNSETLDNPKKAGNGSTNKPQNENVDYINKEADELGALEIDTNEIFSKMPVSLPEKISEQTGDHDGTSSFEHMNNCSTLKMEDASSLNDTEDIVQTKDASILTFEHLGDWKTTCSENNLPVMAENKTKKKASVVRTKKINTVDVLSENKTTPKMKSKNKNKEADFSSAATSTIPHLIENIQDGNKASSKNQTEDVVIIKNIVKTRSGRISKKSLKMDDYVTDYNEKVLPKTVDKTDQSLSKTAEEGAESQKCEIVPCNTRQRGARTPKRNFEKNQQTSVSKRPRRGVHNTIENSDKDLKFECGKIDMPVCEPAACINNENKESFAVFETNTVIVKDITQSVLESSTVKEKHVCSDEEFELDSPNLQKENDSGTNFYPLFSDEPVEETESAPNREIESEEVKLENLSVSEDHDETRTDEFETTTKTKRKSTIKRRPYATGNVQIQIQIEGWKESHVCDTCGKTCSTKKRLDKHQKNNHSMFCCDTCNKEYKSRSGLNSHKLTCGGQKLFNCYICGALLAHYSSYKKHVLGHNDALNFSCNICQKTFRSKWNLKMHETIHTGAKAFKCNKCGASFARHQYLVKHCKMCEMDKAMDSTDSEEDMIKDDQE